MLQSRCWILGEYTAGLARTVPSVSSSEELVAHHVKCQSRSSSSRSSLRSSQPLDDVTLLPIGCYFNNYQSDLATSIMADLTMSVLTVDIPTQFTWNTQRKATAPGISLSIAFFMALSPSVMIDLTWAQAWSPTARRMFNRIHENAAAV